MAWEAFSPEPAWARWPNKGKATVEIDGETWLLEKPLRADFALIRGKQADALGNLTYELTAQNFNPVMAMAARTVIAEAEEFVPVGTIPPDAVRTPGVLVDYLLERHAMTLPGKEIIAQRVAREIPPGTLVNLGIGLPTHVTAYLPPGITVFFQTENGLAGVGPRPSRDWRTRTSWMPGEDSSRPFPEQPASTALSRSA